MSEGKKIRVAVTKIVEVDAAAWALDYGMDPSDEPAITGDVQAYVHGLLTDNHQAQAGVLKVIS